MNNAAINELYLKAYIEPDEDGAISVEELDASKVKKDCEAKIKHLLDKTNSDETISIINEMHDLQNEYVEMIRQNAFVSGFKKGAQLMRDIVS